MELKNVIHGISKLDITGQTGSDVRGIAIDSRLVRPGYLFVALKGTKLNGHDYISRAIEKGATSILCSQLPDDLAKDVTYLKSADTLNDLGKICSNYYNDPSNSLNIIGITGTNGKTSIASWLYQLGEYLGYSCGLLSTIRIINHGEVSPASHTTPDIINLYENLSAMADRGCEYVFMEVSSHALDQNRMAGVRFSGAVFTNISRDHLDYHHDFGSYIKAKKLLFDKLDNKAFALVNSDDKNAEVMLQNCGAKACRYSTRTASDYHGKLVEQINQGMELMINGKEIWVPFIGKFNASNLTAVYGVASELGWDDDEVLRGISAMKQVDGRFEKIELDEEVTAIVDYAHTPDALLNVLEAIREICIPGQRVITVVGAGGNRDKGKRPKMARAACENSEIVILTSDNPRDENPEAIIEDMKSGIPAEMESQVFSVTNRSEAIRLAFALSKKGDFLLVAGKGHEKYQEIKGERFHFDDREELMKLTRNQ